MFDIVTLIWKEIRKCVYRIVILSKERISQCQIKINASGLVP